jgi:hypothetical protein
MVLLSLVASEVPENQTSTESTHQQQQHHHVQKEEETFIGVASQYVMKFFASLLSDQCRTAYHFYHFYYQIGCAFFLLAFLATSYRYGNALYMRCMFSLGCILFLMYSYLVECHPDVLVWTLVFIVINIIHMIVLISKLRPVKFEKEIEEVSKNCFFSPHYIFLTDIQHIRAAFKLVRKL